MIESGRFEMTIAANLHRTRFFFLHHGETDWDRDGKLAGRINAPLNGRGLTQARRAGEMLRPAGIGTICTSPQDRALMTAEHRLPGPTSGRARPRHTNTVPSDRTAKSSANNSRYVRSELTSNTATPPGRPKRVHAGAQHRGGIGRHAARPVGLHGRAGRGHLPRGAAHARCGDRAALVAAAWRDNSSARD